MEAIGYFLAIIIGISLGLIGGGGSILTLPILVYFFSVPPQLATSYSLFIVGVAALTGSYRHYKLGNLQLKPVIEFGIPSVISIILVRKIILPSIPEHLFFIGRLNFTKNTLLMIVFAILMMGASVAMIKKENNVRINQTTTSKLMLTGFAVGAVTGFLGAGGGFLIIPALLFFAALTMKQAIGTSLLIIAANSLIGFAADLIGGIAIDIPLVSSIALLALAGIFIGTFLSKTIKGSLLKPAFGWFVLLTGIYIIINELLMS